jgi:hypothetical protein
VRAFLALIFRNRELLYMILSGPLVIGVMLLGFFLCLGIDLVFNGWTVAYSAAAVGLSVLFGRIGVRDAEPSAVGCFALFAVLLLALALEGVSLLGFLPSHAGVLFGLVMVLCPAWVGWMIAEACYYQVYLRPRLECDLGFQYTKSREQITLANIRPGGVLDRAGCREKDVVANGDSITGFFRRLENARGGEPITLTVVPWSATQPLAERPSKQLTFPVPAHPEPRRGGRE